MSRNFEVLKQLERDGDRIGKSLFTEFDPVLPAERRKNEAAKADAIRPPLDGYVLSEMNRFVQRVFILQKQTAPTGLVFADVEPACAANWVAARASSVLADQAAGSVCIVDAKLNAPTLHSYFGLDHGAGLADALRESGPIQRFAHRVPDVDLTVITAGTVKSDWEALLHSSAVAARIEELRSQYDYVLIDAPPVSNFAHAMLFCKMTDGIVLVVEADYTRRETVTKVKDELNGAGVNLIGAVLNNRKFPIPEMIYRRL